MGSILFRLCGIATGYSSHTNYLFATSVEVSHPPDNAQGNNRNWSEHVKAIMMNVHNGHHC